MGIVEPDLERLVVAGSGQQELFAGAGQEIDWQDLLQPRATGRRRPCQPQPDPVHDRQLQLGVNLAGNGAVRAHGQISVIKADGLPA